MTCEMAVAQDFQQILQGTRSGLLAHAKQLQVVVRPDLSGHKSSTTNFLLFKTNLLIGCCIHFMAVPLAIHLLVASLCFLLVAGLLLMARRPRVEVSVRLCSSSLL